jgi:histidinol-phosphate aminotransferase
MSIEFQEGPASRVDALRAYERAPVPDGLRLRLDANEGAMPQLDLVINALREAGADALRRYPNAKPFEALLAQRFGVDPSQAFVSAGADDVIDRCCRAFLPPAASLLIAEPSFEMFDQYASLCGARVATVPWQPGRFPGDAMVGRLDARVALIAIVTPNNPTGEVATLEDLRRLASSAPHALVVLDHAYVEFADEDLTAFALEMPNVVVVRTFSKAWGLAGCRVGYALGPSRIIRALRAAGGPYPVSAASLVIARALLEGGLAARDAYVDRIRQERTDLYELLERLGGAPRVSQANFVFAELGARAPAVHGTLVDHGILVRSFTFKSGEPRGLRISLPGESGAFQTLASALRAALGPGALS